MSLVVRVGIRVRTIRFRFLALPFLDLLGGERDVKRVRMSSVGGVAVCWWWSRHLALEFWQELGEGEGRRAKFEIASHFVLTSFLRLAFAR